MWNPLGQLGSALAPYTNQALPPQPVPPAAPSNGGALAQFGPAQNFTNHRDYHRAVMGWQRQMPQFDFGQSLMAGQPFDMGAFNQAQSAWRGQFDAWQGSRPTFGPMG
jgi:hypothetical protein